MSAARRAVPDEHGPVTAARRKAGAVRAFAPIGHAQVSPHIEQIILDSGEHGVELGIVPGMQARDSDRVKIEQLIVSWGGKVQDKVNVDTDFVVMGYEPEVRQFTDDELQDPLNRRLLDDQKAQYQAYQTELDKAKELHIPIMNQNRFLYFCGYYDNAQR